MRLVEAHGGESVVLTLGPAEAEEQLREVMALGIDRAIHLVTDAEEWDPQATAAAIVEAIRADEAANGPFDLVVLGNESADSGGYQVGIRVAHALGRPIATGLKGVAVDGGSVRCEREEGAGRDVYVLPLPAVVSVKEGLNLPRYPSVPAKIRAKSKPVAESEPTRAASAAREGPPRASRGPGEAGRGARRGGGSRTARRRGPPAAGGGVMTALVYLEHADGALTDVSAQALALARLLAPADPVHAVSASDTVSQALVRAAGAARRRDRPRRGGPGVRDARAAGARTGGGRRGDRDGRDARRRPGNGVGQRGAGARRGAAR